MSSLSDGDPARGSAGDGRGRNWRDRYDAAFGEGATLDPTSEPVEGVRAYPTSYAPDHLLVTTTEDLRPVLAALIPAAQDFGWGIKLRNLDKTDLDIDVAIDRARRGRRDLDLPTIYRVDIFPQPSPDRDDQPVPPIDAWRLLQRARARHGKDFRGVSLDHVLTLDPYGSRTNPYGSRTNPYGSRTNPYGSRTNPYGSRTNPFGAVDEDSGEGRQIVSYLGPEPVRSAELTKKGRRPVVAVLDTGCGSHPWLPVEIVTRYAELDGRPIGVGERATDPEVTGDLAGPMDGALDASAGHGTFIAGIIRQVAPEADIVSVRVADSEGFVLEGAFMLAVRSLVKWMARTQRQGGRQIDVLSISLGYYHETPEDDLFDRTLSELLRAARHRGCAVVCSAGNDATDRPTFPAALWDWRTQAKLWNWSDPDFLVTDPKTAAPHVAVGALNPNGTVALFSNTGPWVSMYAPGAAVVSTFPPFNGGLQPTVRDDRGLLARETIDPDDFSGGFGIWSGTSFAAPYVAARLAADLAPQLMSGKLTDLPKRNAELLKAKTRVAKALEKMLAPAR